MAGNKSLLNSQFKNTIKMTLTTTSHLGVSDIDPAYEITAGGILQGKALSVPYAYKNVNTPFVVGGKTLSIGSTMWKDDVHLLSGIIADGTNYGFLQVTSGDVTYAGKTIGTSPYHLVLQPGGGNVAINTTITAGSKLNVGGNIRTDTDFVTGTDTAGWIRINAIGSLKSFSSSGSYVNANVAAGGNGWDDPNIYYKVIGKTVFMSFNITNFQNNGAGFSSKFAMLLPGPVQNVKNVLTSPALGYTGLHHGCEGIATYNSPTRKGAVECTVRRGSSPDPWAGQWFMEIYPLNIAGIPFPGNFYNSGGYNETIRGTITFELA